MDDDFLDNPMSGNFGNDLGDFKHNGFGRKLDGDASRFYDSLEEPEKRLFIKAYDFGYKKGHSDGYQKGHDEGYQDGYQNGEADGFDDGHQEGYNDGYDDGGDDPFDDGDNYW